MCIIIAAPAGHRLTKFELKNSWENNRDGGGFMYVKDSEIKIVKVLDSFEKYFKLYSKHFAIAEKEESPMVLHFRIGTHGTKGLHNVHPFRVSKTLAFCHNGTLTVPDHKKFSDTVMYNKHYLKNLPPGFQNNAVIMEYMGDAIGGNKFVFLDTDKNVIIVNKGLGELDEKTGVWYSNTSFRCSRTSYWQEWGETGVWEGHFRESQAPLVTTVKELLVEREADKAASKIESEITDFTECDSCGVSFPNEELELHGTTWAMGLLCPDCKEAIEESRNSTCFFCGGAITEEENYLEMDDDSLYCERCSEQLQDGGILSVA